DLKDELKTSKQRDEEPWRHRVFRWWAMATIYHTRILEAAWASGHHFAPMGTLADSAARKDMTRTIQFMPPVDVGEKVVTFLLKKADKTDDQVKDMTGDEIGECVGNSADEHINTLMDGSDQSQIPPDVARPSVDAAVALGDWFAKNFQMTMRAREIVQDFAKTRARFASMPPPALASAEMLAPHDVASKVNPMQTLQRITSNLNVKAFAQNPLTTDTDIKAPQFDYIVLAHMGFLLVADGRATMAKHAADSENFARAANRMMMWNPAGLKDLLDGKPMNCEELRALEAPVVAELRDRQVPASQVGAPPPPSETPEAGAGSSPARPAGSGLTQ
ncbi:unnamed protein product, partial [Prorocentrum cordatum]